MTKQSQWVFFIEQNPQFSKVASSKVYMAILKILKKSSLTADKLHLKLPQVNSPDIDPILGSLEELKLVSKKDIFGQMLYSVSPLGNKLLKIYATARKEFSIE